MIAIAITILTPKKPRPVCHGGLFLAKAWERYRLNDDVSAACYLREAITRFLLAWCERDGVAVSDLDQRSANKVYRLWCRAKQQKPCLLMLDIITDCNRVVHLQPITCEFYTLLDIVQSMFADEIEGFTSRRKGGAV